MAPAMATPGLRLIQDLLAKSVAKWSSDTTQISEESKRERSDNVNDCAERKIKGNKCKKIIETVMKTEDYEYKKEKVEYTETKPVFHDIKVEASKIKKEFPIMITPTNDRLKRKLLIAETDNCIKKQKKRKKEELLDDKDSKSENLDVTKIKKETEDTETNYNLHNAKKDLQTAEDKSLISTLLKKSAAKYTGNQDDVHNFKKEKVGKDDKFDKLAKKKVIKSKVPLKTEDSDVIIKEEYTEFDTKTEITNNIDADKVPDCRSLKIEQLVTKYTENHDDRLSGKEDIIDEKIKKHKIVKAKEIQLKEKSVDEYENNEDDSKPSKGYRKSVPRKQFKAFSPEEDEILKSAMDNFGDNISILNLAKELQRCWASIRDRVIKLKTGNTINEHRMFSLTEDLVIMDTVLESLPGKTLQEINLPNNGTSLEVATALGRKEVSTRNRWGNQLKPWILQHYSGTLNLNIRRMLANYLADTFDSLDSIDWRLVAKRPKFAGHTQGSLRTLFFSVLFRSTTKNYQNLEKTEITLKNIADNANVAFSEKNCRKVSANVLMRQKQVIDYFEQYVKKHGITNFL